MPKAQAIQINWQFTGSAGIMQVEHATDCFGGAWFKLPLSTEVWHPRHVWRETTFQFAEVLALNGETYVVRVNEFSAMCNWQLVGVQGEQNRCKDRALRKAVTLGSPRTGVIETETFTANKELYFFNTAKTIFLHINKKCGTLWAPRVSSQAWNVMGTTSKLPSVAHYGHHE